LESNHSEFKKLLKNVKSNELQVSGVYSRDQWFYPISSNNLQTRKYGKNIIRKLLHAAEVLESETVLVLPGVVDNSLFKQEPEVIPYLDAYKNSLESLKELEEEARSRSVVMALENVWGKFLYSPIEFLNFVDQINSDFVKVYFDVGNVVRIGYPEDWINILNNKIHAIHVKDFKKSIDNVHGFVGLLQGDVDWLAVKSALSKISYKRWITSEVLPFYQFYSEALVEETSNSISRIFNL
jgi:hexulose-6-phosphate isomerase